MDLWLTGRRGRGRPGITEPLGDGPQLLVRRYGRVVAYCADPEGVEGLGVDMARMSAATRW